MFSKMNIFLKIGTGLHIFSVLWLLFKLIKTKSCGGISGKTQLLFAIAYTTRYWDVFTKYVSLYTTALEIVYVLCHYVIVLLIFVVFAKTYRRAEDNFLAVLLFNTFVIVMIFKYDTTLREVLFTFSISVEAVAIVPQFYMICKRRAVEKSLLLYYLIPLGLYRLLYVVHLAYQYYYEDVFYFDIVAGEVAYVIIYLIALIVSCAYNIEVTNDDDDKNNVLLVNEEIANEVNGVEAGGVDLERREPTI